MLLEYEFQDKKKTQIIMACGVYVLFVNFYEIRLKDLGICTSRFKHICVIVYYIKFVIFIPLFYTKLSTFLTHG